MTTATNQFIALVNEQVTLLGMMAKFKQPADFQFIRENCTETWKAIDHVKAKDFKAPPHHLQTVLDGIALFGWPFLAYGDELKDMMTEFKDCIFFFGNKVLKLDKPADSAWFEAYKALFEAHFKFVVDRNDTITKWTGSESAEGAQSFFKSNVTVATATATPVSAPKVVEKVAVAAPVKKVPVVRPPVKNFAKNQWNVENYLN